MAQRTLTISTNDDIALGTRKPDFTEIMTIGAAIVALMGKSPTQTEATAEFADQMARNALAKCGITFVSRRIVETF